jgi:hypothetical protein
MDAEKKTSDFWQDHSLTFLEMAFRTDRRERLDKPDGYGKKAGDCGDTVEFFINLDGDIHPHPFLRYQWLPQYQRLLQCDRIAGRGQDDGCRLGDYPGAGVRLSGNAAARPFSLCRTGGGHLVSCPGQRPGEPAIPVEKIIPLTARAPVAARPYLSLTEKGKLTIGSTLKSAGFRLLHSFPR